MRLAIICAIIGSFLAGHLLTESIRMARTDEAMQLEVVKIEMTAYSPSPHITDSTPFEMASGVVADPIDLEQLRYVAVSRDLMKEHGLEYGDTIYIGFEIQDTLAARMTNNVDLFMRNLSLARKFGRQERLIVVEVSILPQEIHPGDKAS